MTTPRGYHVAISFLAQDEPLALAIRGSLQPPASVFAYSKAQEQLAGRDGIEAFRTVFREQAQLVVILYRQGWGETPWTRVEKLAIEEFAHEEFAHEEGWEHLLFVRLDASPVPKWIPKPHLYLDYDRVTLADLTGVTADEIVTVAICCSEPSRIAPISGPTQLVVPPISGIAIELTA